MKKELKERIEQSLLEGRGLRLSFEEAADILSAIEPPMGVGCCGSDLTTAAIAWKAKELGFTPGQIVNFLVTIVTRTYDVLAAPDDRMLITGITDSWRRKGLVPAKYNTFAVISWIEMLSAEQRATLPLPVVPEDLIYALNRVRLGIEERRRRLDAK